ncbi:glycosyl hydrolase family 28-related protein [Cohnella soli]|uniref:Glycosyl hydrolase family 28-related protein n=1 Tax=Cohnella soli TaxID=425005 RepID=A0ABW0HSU7_9BACL
MEGQGWIQVRDYGAVGDGRADDTEALRRAIEAAGNSCRSVAIAPGEYRIGSVVIPEPIELVFHRGAMLVLEEGANLTCSGTITAGATRIFDFAYKRGSGVLNVRFEGFRSLSHWLPEWFGAVGDASIDETDANQPVVAGTDSSLAFEKAFLVMDQTGVAALKLNHGSFLFRHEVSVFNGNFRMEGSTHAKFTSVPTDQSPRDYPIHMDTGYITGSNVESLFHIKQSGPLSGYFGFLFEKVFFRSYANGPASALKVTGPAFPFLGAPPRPCVFDHCRFFRFRKAIWSSATFGLGTLNVTNCYFAASDFTGDHYAVYSDAYGGVTNFNFINNVSEQGGKILFDLVHEPTYGYLGSLEGQFRIEGNLLEGQSDPIIIYSNVASGTISGNYFEANSGSIVAFHSIGRDPDEDGLKEDVSTISISDNFYHVLKNPRVVLENCRITKLDLSNGPDIRVKVSGVRRYASDGENGKVGLLQKQVEYSGFSVDFDYLRNYPENAVEMESWGTIPFMEAWEVGVARGTPIGRRAFAKFDDATEWKAIPIEVRSDELFVVGTIIRKSAAAAEFAGLSVADDEGVPILSTPKLVQLNGAINGYTAVFFAVDGEAIAGRGSRLRYECSRPGNEISDVFCYTLKKTAADGQFGLALEG